MIITYADEDKDIITISSNEELEDAFLQFVNTDPPIVRACALTKSRAAKMDEPNHTEKSNPKQKKWKGKEVPRPLRKLRNRVNALEMLEKDRTYIAMKNMLKLAETPEEEEAKRDKTGMNMDYPSYMANMEPVGPIKQPRETAVAPQVEVKATRVQLDTIPKPLVTKAECSKPPTVETKETLSEDFTLDCVSKDFIHGRHTCDGCFTTPIIGYRFHATNLPDYDLCSKCVKNYKGTDVHFQPEELDRDQYLQKRWQAKASKHGRKSSLKQKGDNMKSGPSRPCVFNQIATEFCDAALNEAIKRSLKFEKMMDTNVKSESTVVPGGGEKKDDKEVVTEPVEEEVQEKVQVKDVASQASNEDMEEVLTTVQVNISQTSNAGSEEAEDAPEIEFHCPPAPTHNPQTIEALKLQNETPDMDDNIGAKIVDGAEDDDDEVKSNVSSGSNDWQVVDEDGQVTDHMVAQAAQMLGSALFQSDMASENIDIDSGESFTSGLTSVPSLKSKSDISSVLLTRWEEELRQLHEFGFLDDHANVEALGHLEAANMGVDSDDPVTINAAVDYLLKHRKYEEREA